jgi:hypothetical protein
VTRADQQLCSGMTRPQQRSNRNEPAPIDILDGSLSPHGCAIKSRPFPCRHRRTSRASAHNTGPSLPHASASHSPTRSPGGAPAARGMSAAHLKSDGSHFWRRLGRLHRDVQPHRLSQPGLRERRHPVATQPEWDIGTVQQVWAPERHVLLCRRCSHSIRKPVLAMTPAFHCCCSNVYLLRWVHAWRSNDLRAAPCMQSRWSFDAAHPLLASWHHKHTAADRTARGAAADAARARAQRVRSGRRCQRSEDSWRAAQQESAVRRSAEAVRACQRRTASASRRRAQESIASLTGSLHWAPQQPGHADAISDKALQLSSAATPVGATGQASQWRASTGPAAADQACCAFLGDLDDAAAARAYGAYDESRLAAYVAGVFSAGAQAPGSADGALAERDSALLCTSVAGLGWRRPEL